MDKLIRNDRSITNQFNLLMYEIQVHLGWRHLKIVDVKEKSGLEGARIEI